MATLEEEQKAWCEVRGIPYVGLDLSKKIGISRELLANPHAAPPLHGQRHTPSSTTCGWYVWTGENDGSPDFFVAVHAEHLLERHRHLLVMLGGAPGWRFLVVPDEGHEDVWFDEESAATFG